jgi:hypothetical protein
VVATKLVAACVPALVAVRTIGAVPIGQEMCTTALPAPSVRDETAAGEQPPPTSKLTGRSAPGAVPSVSVAVAVTATEPPEDVPTSTDT